MYRINVITTGKYHNFTTGIRYAITKRSAEKFIELALNEECQIKVEKFTYCSEGIFAWSDDHDLD